MTAVTFIIRNSRTKRPSHSQIGELIGYLPDGRARVKVAGVVRYIAREDLIDGTETEGGSERANKGAG